MREIAAIGQNFQDLSKFNEEEPIAFQPLAVSTIVHHFILRIVQYIINMK